MALPRRKQNFMEGAAVLTLAVAATKVIGAVYKIPLGNLLDKDGMAHFYVAYNIYSLLLIVSTAGLPLALSRLVSRAEAMGRVNQRKRIFRVTAGVFFLLGVWLLRSHGRQKGTDIPDSRREILRQVLEIGIPVTLGSVGMSLITLLDQALVLGTLQSSLGLSEAAATSLYGEYTFGMTLFALPASFMYPLSISLVPSIGAAMAAGREEAAAQNAASALKLAMVLALPVGVGMSVLAGPILQLLYPAVPQTAEAAAFHLRILGLASVFVCLMIATAGILQAYGKERIPVVTLLIGGGVKIAANYLLVTDPAISIHGAPIGTLLCYAIIAGLNLAAIAGTIPGRLRLGGAAGKLLASTGAMAATAWCGYGFLSRHMGAGAATLLAILAAAVVYIVLVLALEVLRREEILQLPKGEKLAKFLYKS